MTAVLELAEFLKKDRVRRQIERERDISTDEIVPLADRLAVHVSADAAESLIYFVCEHNLGFDPQTVGWDLRRTDDDELGFDTFGLAVALRGSEDECWHATDDGGRRYDSGPYIERCWTTFDRPPSPADVLLIDLADEAVHRGWTAPPDIAAALERLRDLAAQSRIRRDLAAEATLDEQFAAEEETKREAFRERLALENKARAEWPQNDAAAQAAWFVKYEHLLSPADRKARAEAPVTIIPFKIPAEPLPDIIKSSGEFIRDFVPPEYLLDRVLQRRFCYSITAQTGVGKTAVAMLLAAHVSQGRALGGLDVAQGSVLYLAGENPTDIQMRWLGLTQELRIDPETAPVHFLPGVVPLSEAAHRITAEIIRKGIAPALVVVDTAAAYNEGDDENSNAQAALHARRLRSLTALPGGPCVLILCHPTKRAADDDLIPRGGGAFLAEVDGNIALRKLDSLVTANALGKFRGPDFSPLSFEIRTVHHHPKLKDVAGRDIPTVIATPVDGAGKERIERMGRGDEDAVLRALDRAPGSSPTDVARTLGWQLRTGAIHHIRAKRVLERLAKEKLVGERRGGWHLTTSGQRDLNDADAAKLKLPAPSVPLPTPR